jgi:hypothetical protein
MTSIISPTKNIFTLFMADGSLVSERNFVTVYAAYHRAIAIICMCKSLQNKEAHGRTTAGDISYLRNSSVVFTVIAPAKNYGMVGVGVKLVAIAQSIDQRRQQIVRELDGVAASAADGVVVGGVRVQRKVGGASAHIRLCHQVQLAQQIKRTIDGSQVDVAVDALHLAVDLFRRHVAGHLFDGVQDDSALWRDADAPLFQGFEQSGRSGHIKAPLRCFLSHVQIICK